MESGEIINNSYKGFEERTSDIDNIKKNKICSTKIIIISISINFNNNNSINNIFIILLYNKSKFRTRERKNNM